jgi:hypothetical protein
VGCAGASGNARTVIESVGDDELVQLPLLAVALRVALPVHVLFQSTTTDVPDGVNVPAVLGFMVHV